MLGLDVFGVKNCSIWAPIFLAMLTYIYTRGIEESNTFNAVFTVLKLITLIMIIFIAFINFNSDNFSPFTLEEHGGFEGTFLAASLIFYGYLGFDFITTLSPDAIKPEKNIPMAVQVSTITCMGLYVLTAVSLAGMAPL